MIDLHTHTTASDGTYTPAELVAHAAAAGVSVLAVTDHDTLGGCEAAAAACRSAGLTFVAGIEITAVRDEKDVHILGYFVDPGSTSLQTFLAQQRQLRIDRIHQIVARLAQLGVHFDSHQIFEKAAAGGEERAIGRPWIARALVAAGLVANTQEAFDRYLAHGQAAFVPRQGAPPAHVFAHIHEAGGLASLAHPGLVRRDHWVDELAGCGLDALEVYHSEHDPATTAHYLAIARKLDLAVTGGSDFHGDQSHREASLGRVSLPQAEFERLLRLRPVRSV